MSWNIREAGDDEGRPGGRRAGDSSGFLGRGGLTGSEVQEEVDSSALLFTRRVAHTMPLLFSPLAKQAVVPELDRGVVKTTDNN